MSDLELASSEIALAASIDRDAYAVVWYWSARSMETPSFTPFRRAGMRDAGVFAISIARSTFQSTNVTSPIRWCSRQSCTESIFDPGHGFIPVSFGEPHISSADPGAPANTVFRQFHASGYHVRPRFELRRHGSGATYGSHYIRYVGPNTTLRLTTNARSISFRRDVLHLGALECILRSG